MTALETERLVLRQWRASDFDDLFRIYADPEVYGFLAGPIDRDRTERQIEAFMRHWDERGFGLWAVDEKAAGRMIGRIGLMHQDEWTEGDDKVEVGWTLDRAVWRRGLATEGALASLRYGFEQVGLPRIISFTLPENVASRRVMEKCGLSFQGQTAWRGLEHVWYAISAQEYEALPGG